MANFNKVILIGRLTSDPELKQTPSGASVTSFSVAVDRRVKQGDEKQTDFISAVAWKERAEFVCKYFKKGAHILIEGELQTRTFTDKQGVKRNVTEVLVVSSGFIDSKPKEDAPADFPKEKESTKNTAADDGLPF